MMTAFFSSSSAVEAVEADLQLSVGATDSLRETCVFASTASTGSGSASQVWSGI